MSIQKDSSLYTLVFGATVLLSAFLLFQVQPMVSKSILPWFGGAPNVWTTCMLVFQTLLFAGYAYAHLVSIRFSRRVQLTVHVALLVAAIFALPILPQDNWKPSGSANATLHVIRILISSVSLPFFVLSTTGPTLQRWFSLVYPDREPYRLYALSNAGSLFALLSYPFLVEPAMSLGTQSVLWSVLFVLFSLLCAVAGIVALRGSRFGRTSSLFNERNEPNMSAEKVEDSSDSVSPDWGTLRIWFLLACVPSVMLLATTNQLCLDVASVPFLWILPLSLYLISFIICFDRERWYSRPVWALAVAASTLAMVAVQLSVYSPVYIQIVVYSCGLFATAMFCHGELARLKPHPKFLTLYYLVISLAGAAGGMFVSVVAPIVFRDYFEIHLGVLAVGFLVLLVLYQDRQWFWKFERWTWLAKIVVPVLLLAAIGLGYDAFRERTDLIAQERNFYGVLRVTEIDKFSDGHSYLLFHGSTVHGIQRKQTPLQPTLCFTETSGIGTTMRFHNADRPRRIGVVGLGAGTITAYGKAGDYIRYYEIDNDMIQVAQRQFTFLRNCPAKVDMVLGDARLMLERELDESGSNQFDVLVIDAFSSGAIPTHLLTREACSIFLEHLVDDGILAMHISNRYFALERVVGALAKEFNLESRAVVDYEGGPKLYSKWILLSPYREAFQHIGYRDLPSLENERKILWTDDYCNVFAALKELELLKKPFSSNEKRFQAAFHRGSELFSAGEFTTAEGQFRLALEHRSDEAVVWIALGNALSHQKKHHEAIDCYKHAIKLNPRSSEGHSNLGIALVGTEQAGGVEHIKTAILLNPRNFRAMNNMGIAMMREKRYSAAAEYFEKALQVNPRSNDARAHLANVKALLSKESSQGE